MNGFYEVEDMLEINSLSVASSINHSYFKGTMNMLCINTQDCSFNNTIDLDSGDRIIDKVNNMGQLVLHQVLRNNQNNIKQTFTYKNVDSDSNRCYNVINKEEIFTNDLNNPIRKIEYQNDPFTLNITKKTLSNQTQCLEDIEYSYDKKGQLIEERNLSEDIKITYAYDKNGNMIERRKYNLSLNTLLDHNTYEYDYNNPNKLTSYYKDNTNYSISYHVNMSSCPQAIINEDTNNTVCTFEWDYKRLTKYSIDQDYYLNFTYNVNGLRTSKVIVNNYAGGTITHSYRYYKNRLIEEEVIDDIKGDEYKLHYLYDQFNELYGFRYENNEYYYIKDSLHTIIGIINSSKQIVCEYRYDGYGNHIVYDGNKVLQTGRYFIGNINPFRYKGYYYDVETSLFWLSSRYYSPELCRFISPDDVEYLDPESINGLNLYAYCNNDPVMCRLGYNLGGVISAPISNIGSISSNISSRSRIGSSRSMSRASASTTPFANVVSMTNYSTTLVDNILFGMALGNISHTTTIQHNNSGVFYAYSNIGNSTLSVGVGLNIKDWYGLNAYVSSNIGIGSSMQLGSITYGAEISVLDGVSFSFGTVSGNVTNETTVSIGWGTLAFAYAACGAIAATPVPMARAVAGVAVCVVVLIDIFN